MTDMAASEKCLLDFNIKKMAADVCSMQCIIDSSGSLIQF